MKRILILFLFSLAIVIFGRNACLANCSTTQPGCSVAMDAGTFWCDTTVDGTSSNPVIKVCSGTGGWYTAQKFSQALTNANTVTNNGAVTQAADFTVLGTRTLGFGANKLTNIGEGTAAGDAIRFEQALLTTGNQTKSSGVLTFNVLPQSPTTPTATSDLTTKNYVDMLSGNADVLFVSTATATADTAAADETLIGSGVGSTTIPANSLSVGDVIRIKVDGYYNNGSSQNMFFKVKMGGTTIAVTPNQGSLFTTVGAGTNEPISVEFVITVRTTGASGTVFGTGVVRWLEDVSNSYRAGNLANSATTTIDTTIDQAIDVTCDVAATALGRNINGTNVVIEKLKV